MIMELLLLVLATLFGFSASETKTQRPIIGVLAETTYGKKTSSGHFYIAASYVKYIESAGGRVVPILPNASTDEVQKLFQYINGVLFPGGGVSLQKSGYAKTGKLLYELAIKEFDSHGVVFPIWGSCLGFELLNVLSSDDKVVFSHFDAENYPVPLKLSEDFNKSKMFSQAPRDIIESVQDSSITMNNHKWGVAPENFQKEESLSRFYKVLSTNKDREGKEYVSTIEGRKYPIFGVQWHPEKNQFEWSPTEAIPHTTDAVRLGQYMANFLVGQARLNDHKFPCPESEAAALIYNYSPIYTGAWSNFTQSYFFN